MSLLSVPLGPVHTLEERHTSTLKHSKVIAWIIYAYVLFIPVQLDFGGAFRLAPSDLFVLLGVFIAGRQFRINTRVFSSWHWGMLFIFVGASAVSLIRNGFLTNYALIQKDVGFLILILTYLMLTSFVDTWDRLYYLLKLFLISVLWTNMLALFVFFSGVKLSFLIQDARLSGMLIDPNAYGGLLVTAFAVHIMTQNSQRPLIGGFMGLVATLTLSCGIVLTFSRSSWIGLAFILMVLTFLKPKAIFKIAIGFAASFSVLLIYKGVDYLNVLTEMSSRPSQIQSRLDILGQASIMINQSPLFGIGLGTYNHDLRIIIHNSPIWFLTEFGVFGLLMYIGFMLWIFVTGFRSMRAAEPAHRPVIIAFILTQVAMMGLSMGIEALYQRYWWLMMGLCAASFQLTAQKHNKI
ncbi:MAG: hypothetical protein JWM44_4452 [Bacilli bacterium]|nr:hypothetical protein [Bacilli bacterium]